MPVCNPGTHLEYCTPFTEATLEFMMADNHNQPAPVQGPQQVEFTGKSGEYFKIWIVSTLLSVLTLGIYGPWAKVRTAQYIYGNTIIGGHRFRYIARPLAILKARPIAIGILAVYSLASFISPVAGVLLPIALALAVPWLLVQGLRFGLDRTSFRNVRFGFNASYGRTFVTFMLLPYVGVFTLSLAMPWVLKKIDQFIHSHISYGNKHFQVETSSGVYYLAVLAFVGTGVAMFMVGLMIAPGFFAGGLDVTSIELDSLTKWVVLVLVCWLGLIVPTSIYRTIIRNHLFRSAMLEDITRFHSDIRVLPYAWLVFSNALLVVVTLGMGYPIAQIRKMRYLASVTQLIPEPDAAHALDDMAANSSVVGEETAEIFNVGFTPG